MDQNAPCVPATLPCGTREPLFFINLFGFVEPYHYVVETIKKFAYSSLLNLPFTLFFLLFYSFLLFLILHPLLYPSVEEKKH